MLEIESRLAEEKNVYFHKEELYHSLEGRKIELVTISSRDGITNEREELPEDVDDIYPES
jgi:hypothetical protein